MNRNKIKERLAYYGITQKELAIKCGKSEQAINKALNDQPWEITVLSVAVGMICEKDPNVIPEELLN